MGLLIDSFWRAAGYCLRPRVLVLTLAPLVVMGLLAFLIGTLYWERAVAAVAGWINTSGLMDDLWDWLSRWGSGNISAVVAPLVLLVALVPLVVLVTLVTVTALMTPALVGLVAGRRFPELERKRGASLIQSIWWSASALLMALVALVASSPLWLVPPMVLVLPPLVWGWLTYRVMAFDALADHATRDERVLLLQRHRVSLLFMGMITGYMGAAPAIVWASGVVFAAAFVVLIPLGLWIYTMVFAFSSLWFAHYCLAALQKLRLGASGFLLSEGADTGGGSTIESPNKR